MKAERRQELRTNELSMQLDLLTEQVRRNFPAIIAAVLGVAVLGGGTYWYIHSSKARVMDAWASLAQPQADSDPLMQIRKLEEIATAGHDASLTAAAWLKVAETALSHYMLPTPPTTGGSAKPDPTMLQTARDAYTKALASPALDVAGLGSAMIGLGVIAENQGDFPGAREWYDKVRGDKRLADSPFAEQAAYRLKGMEVWSRPVVFAPPPPPPASMPAAAPVAGDPLNVTGMSERPVSLTPTTQPAGSP